MPFVTSSKNAPRSKARSPVRSVLASFVAMPFAPSRVYNGPPGPVDYQARLEDWENW